MRILEVLSRVPTRPEKDPMLDADFIGSVRDVVYAILGDKVTENEDECGPGVVFLGQSWTGYPVFSDMDQADSGAIGLVNLMGTTAKDLAAAIHESFHALLHLQGKNSINEYLVNKLALRWAQDHFSGMMLHQITEQLLHSNWSYKKSGAKYLSSAAARKEKQNKALTKNRLPDKMNASADGNEGG